MGMQNEEALFKKQILGLIKGLLKGLRKWEAPILFP